MGSKRAEHQPPKNYYRLDDNKQLKMFLRMVNYYHDIGNQKKPHRCPSQQSNRTKDEQGLEMDCEVEQKQHLIVCVQRQQCLLTC